MWNLATKVSQRVAPLAGKRGMQGSQLLGLVMGLGLGTSLAQGGNLSAAEVEGDSNGGSEQSLPIKPSLREEIIGSYEDRIRNFSTPERVFEFFASVNIDGNTFMTPEDFARSIIPYQHRAGVRVGSNNVKFNFQAKYRGPTMEERNQYKKILADILDDSRVTPQEFNCVNSARERLNITPDVHHEVLAELNVTSIEFDAMVEAKGGVPRERFIAMVDADGDGMISYEEFMLFHTLLSIPPKQLGIAFRMFDRDDSGTIDRYEFTSLMDVMRRSTNAGKSEVPREHRLEKAGGGKLKKIFFGEDGNEAGTEAGKLTLERFTEFVCSLQREALIMQFNQWDLEGDGVLSATEFAMFLATKISMDRKTSKEYLTRAESQAVAELQVAITLDDFLSFHHLLQLLPEMEVAMQVTGAKRGVGGRGLDQNEFKKAVRAAVHGSGWKETQDKISTKSEKSKKSKRKGKPKESEALVLPSPGLSSDVVKVLFALLDGNGDGVLDAGEFMTLMEKHLVATDPPRELGTVVFLRRLVACAANEVF